MKINSYEDFCLYQNVSRETFEKFKVFEKNLVKWQSSINLVSKSTINDIWVRHLLDSSQLYHFIQEIKGDRKNVGGIRTPINYEFPSETVEVGPFIYTMNTDGISDTMNSEKKPLAFGKKRLVAELEKNMSLDPKRTNKLVMDALNEYKGPAPFRDDITLFSFVFNNEVFKQS